MTAKRATAWIIASVVFLGLVIRFYLHYKAGESVWLALSVLYQYFTLWTNTLVFLVMASVAINRPTSKVLILATAVSIAAVGIIFHGVLNPPGGQQGLDLLANLITHTFAPVLCPLWWLVFHSKYDFQWKDSLPCLIFPAVYCVYAIIRAEFSGFYPYPFINLQVLGIVGLVKSIAIISMAFLVLALSTIAISKLRRKDAVD